jgi:hypothetical protein
MEPAIMVSWVALLIEAWHHEFDRSGPNVSKNVNIAENMMSAD